MHKVAHQPLRSEDGQKEEEREILVLLLSYQQTRKWGSSKDVSPSIAAVDAQSDLEQTRDLVMLNEACGFRF
jgi:hypothetical protein